ncbi:tail completion protein gp17 [Oceanobacillus oncorhynchi]|uniref:tail completion protein gp17 n=1 Tax=Oceanobacillus oncorhynchi TaxID=545501 RepID=UPI0034D709C5
MLDYMYALLIADATIKKYADGRIKFYEYPPTGDFSGTYIVLDPIDMDRIGDYADDTYLTEDSLVQIDIWSDSRQERNLVAKQIRKVLVDENRFSEIPGVDEWDKDTGIFRIARRYRKKVYRKDFNNL